MISFFKIKKKKKIPFLILDLFSVFIIKVTLFDKVYGIYSTLSLSIADNYFVIACNNSFPNYAIKKKLTLN